MPDSLTQTTTGALIAFMGLPGSGKSTTAQALAALIPEAELFSEPPDRAWPDAVKGRHRYGYFTALSWFRSMRVPLLYNAAGVRDGGTVAIVDSYYDKLIAGYIDYPGMEWLVPQDDPYFSVAKRTAELDRQLLPIADCLIFLRVSPDVWKLLLSTRQRAMDAEEQFLRSFPTQQAFLESAEEFAASSGCRIILHDQALGSPELTAMDLLEKLRRDGVLNSIR